MCVAGWHVSQFVTATKNQTSMASMLPTYSPAAIPGLHRSGSSRGTKQGQTKSSSGWLCRIFTFLLLGFFMITWIVLLTRVSTTPPREKCKPLIDVDPWEGPLRIQLSGGDETVIQQRAEIRAIFLHAWKAYRKYAWGFDELRPRQEKGHNWMGNGLAATIVDSLSTLYVMGLKVEFLEARKFIEEELSNKFAKAGKVSFFETTIRILGGLLSAYGLTDDSLFLEKAKDIADRLLPAFNTKSGYPLSVIDLGSGTAHAPEWASGVVLAEIGTVQLEFVTLSKHLRDPKYARAALKVIDTIQKQQIPKGLYYLYLNSDTGEFVSDSVSLGGLGDSFYEYLLKMFVLTNHHATRFKRLYESVSEAILNKLLITQGKYTFVAEMVGDEIVNKFDHLACFTGGMFALGAMHLKKGSSINLQRHQEAAAGITETCHWMYSQFPNKLSPESVTFRNGSMYASTRYFILRPEAVESFFVLFRTTRDPKYRTYGWEVLKAINSTCRVPNGFTGLRDVTQKKLENDDTMQSFFLAETLKYLYLLFSPVEFIRLQDFVFNTEAHPLRIFEEKFEEWNYLFA